MSVFEHFDEAYDIESTQSLMLQALILKSPEDEKCFLRWLTKVDFEAADMTSLRLIPALYSKFGNLECDTQRHVWMKSVYRYFQFRSSLIAAGGHKAVAKLHDAGIDVLLFKGIAIALKYHRNIFTRPMGDMDVLVRRESVPDAEVVLRQCSLRYAHPEKKKSSDIHSHDYTDGTRSGFDLHWYSLYESPYPGIDDGIWQRAIFFDWDGLAVKIMSPEDLLLTSIVNGVRDRSKTLHWIHDVATIISAEPTIRWETVWDEAKKRGLREQVFNALILVREISAEIIPDGLLHGLIDNDPGFYRNLLHSAIAEGRTHGLILVRKDEIESILSSSVDRDPPSVPRNTANPMGGKVFGSPRHIRYFLDESGDINRLFLQWQHLPVVAELFEVSDRTLLDSLVSNQPMRGEGFLSVPAGLLATKLKPKLPAYGARITVVDTPPVLVLPPGQNAEITVEVENNSACCWPVCGGSPSTFGLTYHLLSEDGKTVTWNTHRTHLLIPRRNYVRFIEPSQKLVCRLIIANPGEPGRYIVQLDLVHEHTRWFSELGHLFPRISLEILS